MSRSSARKSSRKSAKSNQKDDTEYTYDDFVENDPDMDANSYTLNQLKAIANEKKIRGRSKMKKEDLYDAIKEVMANGGTPIGSIRARDDDGLPIIRTKTELLTLNNTKLRDLISKLKVPNRAKANNKAAYVKLLRNFYKSPLGTSPAAITEQDLDEFDPSYPESFYTKAVLFEMATKAKLPVSKSMNQKELYETLRDGVLPERVLTKRSARKSATSAKKDTSDFNNLPLDELSTAQLRCRAMALNLPHSKKTKQELLDLIRGSERPFSSPLATKRRNSVVLDDSEPGPSNRKRSEDEAPVSRKGKEPASPSTKKKTTSRKSKEADEEPARPEGKGLGKGGALRHRKPKKSKAPQPAEDATAEGSDTEDEDTLPVRTSPVPSPRRNSATANPRLSPSRPIPMAAPALNDEDEDYDDNDMFNAWVSGAR